MVAGVTAFLCLEPVRPWEAGQRCSEHHYYPNQNGFGCCMTYAPAFVWGIPMDLRLPSVLSVVAADLHLPTEPHCLTLQLNDAFSLRGSSYSLLSASSGMTLLASMVVRIRLLPYFVCTRSLVASMVSRSCLPASREA